MLEGNLKSVSVSGLLQLLANEAGYGYQVTIKSDTNIAQIYIVRGTLIDARFGILEGVDALSEIITWSDGSFKVEEITSQINKNFVGSINCNLSDIDTFHNQCLFLNRIKVGLGQEIIPSTNFGQEIWQKALHIQPLKKVDFAVLGWITDGRTMRQAISELKIDLKDAIGILYRLVITGSIEVIRPDVGSDMNADIDFDGLVKERLELHRLAKKIDIEEKTKLSVDQGKLKLDDAGGKEEIPNYRDTGDLEIVQSKFDTKDGYDLSGGSLFAAQKDTDTQELPTVKDQLDDEFAESLLESPLTKIIEAEAKLNEGEKEEEKSSDDEPKEKPKSAQFDIKKTDPLPIVSIDIERLINTSFEITETGNSVLADEDEGEMVEEILNSVRLGKSIILVLTDSNMSDASVMATYRYCLENKYIKHHDPVVPLSMDLVMGKMDLIQYLLQRKRISGDQLKEFGSIAERQGIEIIKLLVGAGALLNQDIERLQKEKDRFAPN